MSLRAGLANGSPMLRQRAQRRQFRNDHMWPDARTYLDESHGFHESGEAAAP
jgi:hypothetical protein